MTAELVTYEIAAARTHRAAATIRWWVHTGRLTVRERRGRQALLDMAEVWPVEKAAREQDTRRVAGQR